MPCLGGASNPSNYRIRPIETKASTAHGAPVAPLLPPSRSGRWHCPPAHCSPHPTTAIVVLNTSSVSSSSALHSTCQGQGYPTTQTATDHVPNIQTFSSWSSRGAATLSIPSLGCHPGSSLTACTGSPSRRRFSCRSTCIPRGVSYTFNTLHLPLARHPIADYLQRISRSRPTVDSSPEDPCAQTFLLPFSSSQQPQRGSRAPS